MRVVEMIGKPLQAVGFFKGREVLALEILDQRQLERFRIVGNLLDAGKLMQARGFRSMIATLTGNNVVGIFARDVAHQQRLQHALLADRIGKFANIADEFARLIGIRTNLIDRDHAANGRATETRQSLDVVGVMPHLESDG